MIISASRRTDIPAYYAEWFMNRIDAGYCAVPNPFNRNQVSYISLDPENVEAIVFWTRNPARLMPRLTELDQKISKYYFQFTLVNNPKEIDPHSASLKKSISTFQQLADQIGKERVIWRYDPIFLSNITGFQYHIDQYCQIAEMLKGYTNRSVISFVDSYRKAGKRIKDLDKLGIKPLPSESLLLEDIKEFVSQLVVSAETNGMEIQSCAENINLISFGIQPGKCIDDALIRRLFKNNPTSKKDPSQREECGCVASRDIGVYDSCLNGCVYCYATKSFELARKNYREHNPNSPSLVGWYDAEPPVKKIKKNKENYIQGNLFPQ